MFESVFATSIIERERQTDRQTKRETDTETQRERERKRERERERDQGRLPRLGLSAPTATSVSQFVDVRLCV